MFHALTALRFIKSPKKAKVYFSTEGFGVPVSDFQEGVKNPKKLLKPLAC